MQYSASVSHMLYGEKEEEEEEEEGPRRLKEKFKRKVAYYNYQIID